MSGDNFLEYDYFEPKQLGYVLTPGEASFKITGVTPKTSKTSGHKMLHVTFDVTDCSGKRANIDDYLVATKGDSDGMKRLATKIMNISKSIGKPDLYAPGYKLKPNDLLGERGKCEVKTQTSGEYPDKSVISKYIATKEPLEVGEQVEDDIPF